MATELKMTLLLRRAAFADSCVLQLGEPGYHTGTKEFKIGDGSTTWKELPIANKTQIEAIVNAAITAHAEGYYTKKEINSLLEAANQASAQVASELAAEVTARTNADTQIRTDFAAADAATLQSAQGYADTKKAEVIGDATSTKDSDTVKGAKLFASDVAATAKSEAISTAASDATSKANTAEANAKAYAETKASAAETAAKNHADSQDAALETSLIGGDTDTTYAKTIKGAKDFATAKASAAESAAKSYADDIVAAEKADRETADTALDNKITALRNEIGNLTNVMNFRGAVTSFDAITNPVEGDVITFSAEVKDGDSVVAKAGSEWVYSGNTWVEIGTASASDAAIAALKSRMDAAEGDIDQAQSDISALGTNKLDKTTYEDYIVGKSMSDEALKGYADDVAGTAKSEAITEAGKLDATLKTEIIGGDADTTYAKTIKGAKDYAKAYADSLANNYDANGAAATAEENAKKYADSQDAALLTAIEGGEISGDTTAKTIKGAKEYAKNYTDAREVEIKKYVDQAESDAVSAVVGTANDASSVDTVKGAKKYAEEKASAAEAAAKEALIGGDTDAVYAKTVKGAKEYAKAYADSQDAATLTTAQNYADTVAANAVKNNIKAGNADIVINRPTEGDDAGKTIISHKSYGSGTYTKPDSVNDANFVTGVTIENGHVTGASVKSLAEALAAMTFIFDGGTSAN